MLPPPSAPTSAYDLQFRVVTYNCLSAQGVEQVESLDWQFWRAGVSIAALQETRAFPGRRTATQHFHVLSSEDTEGQLGCQVWLTKDRLDCSDSQTGTSGRFWESASFAVLYSQPRFLLVTVRCGRLKLAVLSAHALTGKARRPEIDAWWMELQGVLRRIPPGHVPLLCIDANAHFAWDSAPPAPTMAQNHNASCMARLLATQQLTATANCLPCGNKVITWRGPQGAEHCLDFIACPTHLAAGMQLQGTLPGFTGKSDRDHEPVLAQIRWKVPGAPLPKACRFDTKQMLTDAGKAKIRAIFASTPRVDWTVDVDSHLHAINTHLTTELSQAFPLQCTAPRSYVLQQHSWQLIQDRRDLQRDLHRCKLAQNRTLLRQVWNALRGHSTSAEDFRLGLQTEALYAKQLRDLRTRVQDSKRKDLAAAAQAAISTARLRGPEALHRHFRYILRSGRRFREPAIQPAILQPDGKFAADSHLVLGQHFATAERATLSQAERIFTTPADLPQQPLQAQTSLSVAALARGFGGLATGKATGPTGLPMELYKADPIGAASVHQPLVMKAQIGGCVPALWRGGHNIAIPKPHKPIQTADAWRAILLCESSLKGVSRAIRGPLLECLEKVRTTAQGGSRPGSPLQIPMAYAQGHLRALRRDGATGALLFVDGKSAFYSTLRQGLFGREGCLSTDYLDTLANALFDSPQERLHFITQAVGPGILAATDVPEPVRRLVTATLRDTWYSVGTSDKHFFETRTGTSPGSPNADIQFQLVFAQVIHKMEALLAEMGAAAQATCHHSQGRNLADIPAPSWMDDLAIPLRAGDAPLLMDMVTKILQELWRSMKEIGLDINFSQGKTELLPVICGAGSRDARKQLLCERGAQHVVPLSHNSSVTLHITSQYVHLGTLLDSSRMITGISVQGLTDDEICQVLGIANPQEARMADLVRHYGWVIAAPDTKLRALWLADTEWFAEVDAAIAQVACSCNVPQAAARKQLEDQPSLASTWARRYTRHCVKARESRAPQRRQQLWALQCLREAGFLLCVRKPTALLIQDVTCEVCGESFATAAACAAHRRKRHGIHAPSSQAAFGTACQVCGTEFWSASRLQDHLKKQASCRNTILAAEIEHDCPPQPKGPHYAWLPATKLVGPLPWWASLRPPAEPVTTAATAPPWHRALRQLTRPGNTLSVLLPAVRSALVHGNLQGATCEDLPVAASCLPVLHKNSSAVSPDVCKIDTVNKIELDLPPPPLEYLDMVLIHFPPCPGMDGKQKSPPEVPCYKDKSGCTHPQACDFVRAQWSVLTDYYNKKKIRAIGVSNYCSACFECLSGSTVMPMVNQVQLHVGMGADPQGFRSFAEKHQIVLQAWSPLGSGGHGSTEILSGNLTTSIGKKYGKSPVQVALKWIASHNVSIATKSSNKEHLKANTEIFDFKLSDEDLASLDAADFAKEDTPSFLCSDPAPSEEAEILRVVV
ncbi:Prostaglandin F synthase [Symbiodinium microadriaticum]|uniref:Prostaglandin F synthase n=1 Tax=Symbiodinium microadriaticum TaxID=2951 RepID=A0A1Q9CFS2_SYMMI|nr:Prostaglandin F synthase [Symbiodinium microadriaticum]